MTGPSPLQNLVGTIFKLQDLRQRDEAAALAREQFGLEQTRVGLTQQQMAEQGLSLVQNLAEHASNPTDFLQHVPFLSNVTGAPQDVLRTVLSGTPPTVETQRAGQVAKGLQSAGGTLAPEAAATAVTGQSLGGLARSGLDSTLLQGAQKLVGTLSPAETAAISQRVAERAASGMSPADATMDELFQRAPKEVQNRAFEIGRGLAPNANAELQGRLGFAQNALQVKSQEFEETKWGIQLQIMQAEAEAKLRGKDPATIAGVNSLLHDLDQTTQDFIKNSTTLTKTGIVEKGAFINTLIDRIHQLVPELQLPPKIKPGDSPSATSGFIKFIYK